MARRGGFGGMGMPGNMNNLMKQAQRMQRQMEENKKKSITIDPDAADPDDVETLQDMILIAVNDVLGQIEEESSKLMGGMGGLGF